MFDTVYEVVKAVNAGYKKEEIDSRVPDVTVMRCYWVNPKPDYKRFAQHKIGQITEDFFKYSFYGPFNKEYIEQFKNIFEKK